MNAASLANALVASVHALRSYQLGNSAPDLAASIADAGEAALLAAGYGDALLIQSDANTANRQHGLTVEIVHGRLVIAIGVDALMTAVDGGPHSPDDLGYRIDNRDGFAADIVSALRDEEEDGTTLVHVMLDTATEKSLDGGSTNVTYVVDEEVVYDRDGPR